MYFTPQHAQLCAYIIVKYKHIVDICRFSQAVHNVGEVEEKQNENWPVDRGSGDLEKRTITIYFNKAIGFS